MHASFVTRKRSCCVPPPTPNTPMQVNNIVGAGLLAQPWTLKRTSLIVGVVTLLVMAALNHWTIFLLAECCDLTGCYTYKDMGQRALGKKGGFFIQCCVLFYALGKGEREVFPPPPPPAHQHRTCLCYMCVCPLGTPSTMTTTRNVHQLCGAHRYNHKSASYFISTALWHSFTVCILVTCCPHTR